MGIMIISLLGVLAIMLYILLCIPKCLYVLIKIIYYISNILMTIGVTVATTVFNIFGYIIKRTKKEETDAIIEQRQRDRHNAYDTTFQSNLRNSIEYAESQLNMLQANYVLAEPRLFNKFAKAIEDKQFNNLAYIAEEIKNSHHNRNHIIPNRHLFTYDEIKNAAVTMTHRKDDIVCDIIEKDNTFIIKAMKHNNVVRLFQVESFFKAKEILPIVFHIMLSYNRQEILNEWM